MKRILSFLLIFVLFFTLVACNGGNDNNSNKETENPKTEPPVTETPGTDDPVTEEDIYIFEELGGQTMIFYVGQTGTFPEGFTYSTKNTDVIEITGNSYRTLKEGRAVVTVEKDKNKLGVYVIAVYGTKQVELEYLILTNKPDYLTIANVIKLEYQKDPIDANNFEAIVWSSSDDEIASVDRTGVVTPKKMGNVTITLSAINTNVKKEFNFTVLPRDTRFELNYDEMIGICDTVETVLTPYVLTDFNFDGNITWYSEDSSIVEVTQDGTTSFKNPGTTYVCIKGEINYEEVVFKCKVTVLEDNGYTIIRTPEQLQEIGNTSGYYMLGNDIDMKDAVSKGGLLYNNGNGFMPLFESADKAFVGVFDGNGFSIKNMYINRPNDVFVAFMRYISAVEGKEGLIKNLAFEGGEIIGGNYTAVFYANCHGYGSANSGLRDAYVNMKVSSIGSLSALVGNNKGLVENCIVEVEFDAVGDAYLFALNHTGLEEGLGVNNCIFIGDAKGAEFAKLVNGGFATNCYKISTSEVSGFEFNMGANWCWTKGSLPTLKGVSYE